MASVALVGGTGLVGSHILTHLLPHQEISHIEFLARRPPPPSITSSNPPKLSIYTSPSDPSTTWSTHLRTSTNPPAQILFSALATTRANAGGLAAQRALEHDANIALAHAAKDAGAKVYVLISSFGANPDSRIPYVKLKGDIEESVKAIGFERTVIVRPHLIAGQREERRVMEGVVRGLAAVAGWVSKPWLKDWWAQDAEEIAKAAVRAGVREWEELGKGGGDGEGEGGRKVVVLEGRDIVRLGRTEWKGE
ncbi:hypothetical protein FQN50_002287 [Emmonsiellopsis sp. PD_5]|nr:hypothetical protein FQN50_002287 [Emmonsiellopsis sp. PD_5]